MRLFLLYLLAVTLFAQEAQSGADLRGTVTVQGANANGWDAGVKAMLYPTVKLNEHWSLAGTFQVISRPYTPADAALSGRGVRGRIMQSHLDYSKTWENGYLLVRAGQLSTAFGSFAPRYDDADNPLTATPPAYGYYSPVSLAGVAGLEVNAARGKWDGRAQFVNSSPANPRSIFDKDQYANWAGGAGYSIRQGLRVGISGYRGPYLDRHYAFYFPGEGKPRDLPGSAVGLDGEWATGHWNLRGEWQRFVMTYALIPTYTQTTAYAEVKRVLHPRWFVATRVGHTSSSAAPNIDTYEGSVAFRPNSEQILKAGFTLSRNGSTGLLDNSVQIQLITRFHTPALAWR